MHSFKNPFAEINRKTLLSRVYPKSIVRKDLNTKTSKTVKHFLKQSMVFDQNSRKTLLSRAYLIAIVRNISKTKTSSTI